tara:strand:+ start:4826 stop:5440 length:615 start_codon:yes stop_codon:yes gene_type:complete
MTVSYPLTMPTTPAFVSQQWSTIRGTGISESPFTGGQQTVEFAYAKWKAVLTLPPMRRPQASAWTAFFAKLHGRRGTFLLGDQDAKVPQINKITAGTITGSVTLSANADIGDTVLNISGTTAFKAGDYIQLGSSSSARLYIVVEDQGGGSTIQVEPKLKTAAQTGATITYDSPKGLFRMDSNELMWDTNAVSVYGISFSCTEAD